MPRMPRPVLWWSPNEDGSDAISSALVNKRVWLHGRDVRQHTPFRIHQRNLLTRIPRLGRRLFGTWVSDIPTVDLGGGAIRSEFPWQAAHIAYVMSSSDYYFIDGNGGVSGKLTVSNTPTAHFKSVRHGGSGLRPRFDTRLSEARSIRAELGYMMNDYAFGLEGEIIAPSDPEIEIEVLNSSTSADLFYDIARGILDYELMDLPYSDKERYLPTTLRQIESFLGRRFIHVEVHGATILTATEEKPSPFSFTVRGDGPAQMLFAVQVHNLDTGTISISEFLPITVVDRRSF